VAARPESLDDELKDVYTALLTRAAATGGEILSRAIGESGAEAPRFPIGIAGALATASLPLFVVTAAPTRRRSRRLLRAMSAEQRDSGGIERTLPESARSVRDAYEVQVMKKAPRKTVTVAISKPSPPAATQKAVSLIPSPAGQPLTLKSPLASLPSVAPKQVAALEAAGLLTLGDLIAADADDLASRLHPLASAADVTTWQDEAALCCDVPDLAPAEARLLIACGVTGPRDLAALSPIELWELVVPVAESPDGRRLLGSGTAPDLDAVTRWIEAARRPRAAA
jgi:hypothetical protein